MSTVFSQLYFVEDKNKDRLTESSLSPIPCRANLRLLIFDVRQKDHEDKIVEGHEDLSTKRNINFNVASIFHNISCIICLEVNIGYRRIKRAKPSKFGITFAVTLSIYKMDGLARVPPRIEHSAVRKRTIEN